MNRFEARLQVVRQEVADACDKAGRDPNTVRILAASKGVSPQRVHVAHAAGLPSMGENRAQSLRDKASALSELAEHEHGRIDWHFIGHLQKNKVRHVVGRVSMIHTVHDLVVARALSARMVRLRAQGSRNPLVTTDLSVLVQVNLGEEPTKSGAAPGETLALCQGVTALPGLQLRGLMTIPPRVNHPTEAGPWFAQLAQIAAAGRAQDISLHELSMGMSWDFPVAIAHGATIIRLGTRLFGPR